jgi:hypothetical protein
MADKLTGSVTCFTLFFSLTFIYSTSNYDSYHLLNSQLTGYLTQQNFLAYKKLLSVDC